MLNITSTTALILTIALCVWLKSKRLKNLKTQSTDVAEGYDRIIKCLILNDLAMCKLLY